MWSAVHDRSGFQRPMSQQALVFVGVGVELSRAMMKVP